MHLNGTRTNRVTRENAALALPSTFACRSFATVGFEAHFRHCTTGKCRSGISEQSQGPSVRAAARTALMRIALQTSGRLLCGGSERVTHDVQRIAQPVTHCDRLLRCPCPGTDPSGNEVGISVGIGSRPIWCYRVLSCCVILT